MKVAVVLAMHGVPPKGFPKNEMIELFGLHERLAHSHGPEQAALRQRHDMLEEKMRNWPRNEENDPYFAATERLAKSLREVSKMEVFFGFNEFCAPDLGDALDRAAATKPDKIVVITPMMTSGGEHSEVDIPKAIADAKEKHPGIEIAYAWPFESGVVARFLTEQIERFI